MQQIIVVALVMLLISGCALKQERENYFFWKKKTSHIKLQRAAHRRLKKYSKQRVKTISKTISKKNYSKKYLLYFPSSSRKKVAIAPSKVVIYRTFPKECRIDGWLSFYVKPPLQYRSTLLKDIIRLKRREDRLIRHEASLRGLSFIYNRLDEKHLRYDYVYDPKLKGKFQVVVTPHKRLLIKGNRIYKIAVRVLECGGSKGGRR